jgi:glycosyltransferase involved in cell wall biosynthesis
MIGPFGLKVKTSMLIRALPLAQALVRHGHAVKIVVPPWDCPQEAGRTLHEAGVDVENIDLPASLPLLFHVNVTRRLIRRALDFQPDVIHCFKPKAYAGLSAWWLWQLRRLGRVQARLIVDTDDWESNGGWNDLAAYSWAQRRMFAWQERWGLTHADGVTAASRTLQSIVWSLGVKPSRVAYVPNGVRTAEHGGQHEAPRTPQSACRILLYTRFFEFKVERLLEVLRRVSERVPDVKLSVVGKGFFGEEEELLRQAEAIGLRDRIEYEGWVEADRLPEVFARSNVAIYPFDDTLINRAKCAVKLIDLLAAGVPVVADAVGQNVEYVRHNETGLIVPGGDTDAMAQAVLELLRDPDRAARLGAKAARDVRERFSWDRLAVTVEQIYSGYAR